MAVKVCEVVVPEMLVEVTLGGTAVSKRTESENGKPLDEASIPSLKLATAISNLSLK